MRYLSNFHLQFTFQSRFHFQFAIVVPCHLGSMHCSCMVSMHGVEDCFAWNDGMAYEIWIPTWGGEQAH